MKYQEKLEKMMEYIQDKGFYKGSSYLIMGKYSDVPIDANSKVVTPLPEEKRYDPVLLFTVLTSLMKKSLMYRGAPGTGKTTVAEYVGHFIYDIPIEEILDAEIHGNPEQTEEKMIARLHTGKLVKEGEESIRWRKFCDCPVHIIDEVNRLPADKADILYHAIDRGIVKYMDEVHNLKDGPIFATANYQDAGNFIMTPPFVDRFSAAVKSPIPDQLTQEQIAERGDLKKILTTEAEQELNFSITKNGKEVKATLADLKLTEKDLKKIREEISAIPFEKEARNYLHYLAAQVNFCIRGASTEYNPSAVAFMNKGSCEYQQPDALCKQPECHYYSESMVCRLTKNELSVRSILSTYDYCRALTWLVGQDKVTTEIVKTVFPYTTFHKLEPTQTAINTGPGIKNDRLGLIGLVIKTAEEGFKRAIAKDGIFENYGAIINAYEKVGKGEMTPEDFLNKVEVHGFAEISQHDDPIKYSLAVWLQKIHHDISTRYNVKKKK